MFILGWRSTSKGIKIPATIRFSIRTTKQILIFTITRHDTVNYPFTEAIQINIPSPVIPFFPILDKYYNFTQFQILQRSK
jgi:hypothetical protein